MRRKDYKMYKNILKEIRNDNMVTEAFIAKKYQVSERTIRRYINDLKKDNKICLLINGKERAWKILS